MNNFESLVKDLRHLGIKANDTLFVRISYKAVGETDGGPSTLINALLAVIGEGGTLIATAFPPRILAYKRKKYNDIVYTKGMKPTTGIIPVIMAKHPRACFSAHPISPYVAIGYYAEDITNMHTPETESYDVVKCMIEKYHCKCLRIGGHVLDGTTHLAFTEGLRNTNNFQYRLAEGNYYLDKFGEKKWMEKSVSAFCYAGFEKFFFDKIYNSPGAVLSEGKIGNGMAVLTDMASTLAIEREYIAVDPSILSCNSPRCEMCRVSFSYSDQSFIKFAFNQTKDLFRPKSFKDAVKRIKLAYLDRYYGVKCQ